MDNASGRTAVTGPGFTIMVPTRNESSIIEANAGKILAQADTIPGCDVLFLDTSEDDTLQKLQKLAKQDSRVRVVQVSTRGIGAALRQGLKEAQHDLVMFYPADCAWNLSIIKSSYDRLLAGADLVIGGRISVGDHRGTGVGRRIGSWGFRRLIRLFARFPVKDTQGTFTLRRSKLGLDVDDLPASPAMQAVLILAVVQAGGVVEEIPCKVEETRDGSSVSVLQQGPRMLVDIIKFRFRRARN